MTDITQLSTPEILAELARRGTTYSGLANLVKWDDNSKGSFVRFALDMMDEDETILFTESPFKGLLEGAKDGQPFFLLAVMTTRQPKKDSPVDEMHNSQQGAEVATASAVVSEAPSEDGGRSEGDSSDRRKWKDVPYAARAGIRCGEEPFQAWLLLTYESLWWKATPVLKDIYPKFNSKGYKERFKLIAAFVVRSLCEVDSRAEILPGTPAAEIFDELDGNYFAWQKHKDRME